MNEYLRLSSYNCKNVKNSIDNIKQMCEVNDIVFLQETWLTCDELTMLKCLHTDFYADGVSVMDTSSGILRGRPFGGIGFLCKKLIYQVSLLWVTILSILIYLCRISR